ncbi:MAG: hypothetical protein MRERV_43c018 [Mycoplasmataceae bacterium RV_VA103A]|nr:MAG: hypothetical protein MRERV_43c018 [Mycoplasmataceae bacterium RV_VA103A]
MNIYCENCKEKMNWKQFFKFRSKCETCESKKYSRF